MNDTTRRTVAVIGGGGVMGHGIAISCLAGGHEVRIASRRPESVARGLELVADGDYGLRAAVRRGKLTDGDVDGMLTRLSGAATVEEAVMDADIVFETVAENLATKHEVLRAAERAAPDHAVFASNTSAIMI